MSRLLQSPDNFLLRAAHGWLELGNHIEADVELDKVTLQLRAHPDVLKGRWKVYAAVRSWDVALDIALAIIQMVPDDQLGWVNRSYVLHELKRTPEARDNLLRVVDRFQEHAMHAIMRCNLAVAIASWPD